MTITHDQARLARQIAEEQGRRIVSGLKFGFPHVTDGARWRRLPVDTRPHWDENVWHHGNWTAGFGVGFLLRLYQLTGAEEWVDGARRCLEYIAPRATDTATHDIGFLFWPSFALGADLLGDAALRGVALSAARTLNSRLQPGGYLAAWGPVEDVRARESSTIDTMMNLPLLWWSGDETLRRTAQIHATTALRAYIRPDGSTYHRVRFDPDSGEFLERGTFQGLGDESCWSRGQAWALAGFAKAWRETSEPAFRATANRVADYFLERLGTNIVPPWDFGDRSSSVPLDSSAAVIAACGLLELGRTHEGLRLFDNVFTTCLNTADGDGLLLHACYSKPHGDGVDSAVIWGDYFGLTGLAHLTQTVA